MPGAGGVGGSTSGGGGASRNGGCGGSSPSGKGVGGSNGSPGNSNKTSGAPGGTTGGPATATNGPAKSAAPSTNVAVKAGINTAPMTKAALNAKFDAKAKTAPTINPAAAPAPKTRTTKTAPAALGPTSLKNLAGVNPQLAARAKAVAADLAKKGVQVAVTSGYRSKAEQKALYAQGRQPLAQVNALRKAAGMGPITAKANLGTVTKAKPGSSLHNFGLAVDMVPVENGKPTWTPKDPKTWNTIAAAAKKFGLTPGPAWDKPHYELRNGLSLGQIQNLANKVGLSGLWNSVNAGYPAMP